VKSGYSINHKTGGEIMTRYLAKAVFVSLALIILVGVPVGLAVENRDTTASAATEPEKAVEQKPAPASAETTTARYIAIAIMVSSSVLGAGYAVGRIGSSVMGALTERPELFGRSIIFLGLAEGLAIYGLLMGLLLLLMVK
jgi:V/A-type H+-transporting ATPase subunit K